MVQARSGHFGLRVLLLDETALVDSAARRGAAAMWTAHILPLRWRRKERVVGQGGVGAVV